MEFKLYTAGKKEQKSDITEATVKSSREKRRR
jgi:hypothetical protein